MNDRAFSDPDVRAKLSEWGALTRQIEELRREVAEEVEIIGLIATERDDLRRENARLRRRLDAMKAERDREQRANRRPSYWGALWALLTNGRTR
jgi:regulator of replication initiation timing